MATVKERGWFGRLFGKKGDAKDEKRFHAVVIRAGREPCQSVIERSGQRVLSAEAALLPLKDCDRPDRCSCRYQHFDDRRRGPRRGDEIGAPRKKGPDQPERRLVRGRRAEDAVPDNEPVSVHDDSYYQHAADTTRTAELKVDDGNGVDPYNSGSFDKGNAWKSVSKK